MFFIGGKWNKRKICGFKKDKMIQSSFLLLINKACIESIEHREITRLRATHFYFSQYRLIIFISNVGQGLFCHINVVATPNSVSAPIHLADLNHRSPISKVLLIDRHCTDGKEVTDKLSR